MIQKKRNALVLKKKIINAGKPKRSPAAENL